MIDIDLAWLAGLLEGEGSFLAPAPSAPNRPVVVLAMTDEEVVRKAAALMGATYFHCRRDERNPTWKPYWSVRLRGARAVQLMHLLRPYMGRRRQGQIDSALAQYSDGPAGITPCTCEMAA